MNPVRFSLIRAQAAKMLRMNKPYLQSEEQLLEDIRLFVRPAPTELEFNHVMLRMEQAKQIIRHRTGDEGVKVKLTELGEAEFPE